MELLQNGINAKEFARLTGMHFNTVYKMIKKGEIEAVKEGKSYVIPYNEVDKYKKLMSSELVKEAKNKLDIYKDLEEKAKNKLDIVTNDIIDIFKSTIKMDKNINGVYGGDFYKQLIAIKDYIELITQYREHYKSMARIVKEQKQLYKQILETNEMIKNDIPITEEYLEELKTQGVFR